MTSDLAKLMEYIDSLQTEAVPEPVVEIKNKIHPLLQAMQELKEESIVESTPDIKDQIEKAIIVDGGNIDEYFVRSSRVDKLGFSPKQEYKRHPDVDDPIFDVDYIGTNKGRPALWFYPALFYLTQNKEKYAFDFPYIWLVRIRPNAWLQPADTKTKTIQEPPTGKERVGILKKGFYPQAIFFKTAFDVVDKFVNHKVFHKTHGQVKGPQVDEEIAYHGTVDDINEFHPFTHFGTEKAAKDRMEYKKIKDGKIYKVDLDIKNPLTIKDFPGIHYDRQYAFELRDKGLISQEEMEAITFIQDKQELRNALLDKLNELGIDGFVYKNKYEDKGNISYVIVDPSQVKVLSVEPATEDIAEEYTFDQKRRQLNIPELIKRGAFYITHPHGPDGWETDRPDWDFSLITLQNILQKSPEWSTEYKKYIRPESYNKATQEFFSKLSDQKYQQILWSIKKLGIPDDVAFLDKLDEASPDTLEGSFTPDLVESKTWLAKMLAKGLKGKNAGTIYVLGSWYGNMGIFLQQAGVKFDKLVLVEPDEEALMQSKELLDTLNDDGKLILIHQNAEDVVYEKPGVVINTSCNETGPVFLTKLPDNMLCLLQARNNVDNVLIETDSLEEFKELFSLNKTYFTGEKELTDPETEYTRYMIIGRSGKSQSITENSGFDQEAGIGIDGKSFKFKIRDLVAFADDYPVTEIDPKQFIDQIKGRDEDPDQAMDRAKKADLQYPIIVVKRKNGNLWIADGTHRAHKAILKKLPTIKAKIIPIKDMSPFAVNEIDETASTGQGGGSAGVGGGQMVGGPTTYEQEYNMFKRKGPRRITAMTNEALDSSYPYEGKAISGRYTFETEDGVFYKVYFQGKDLVEIAFSAILPGEEENFRPDKTTITGTGNSRKVFGTVVKIVQEYVDAHEPKALYFISNDEPSRVRLYQTMTDQVGKALPDYYAVKPTDLGDGKAFMLKRKTNKVNEALDSSYPYEYKNNSYYFTTDAGEEYKVMFDGNNKKVEVVFVAKGKYGQAKDNITGAGDSRKVFGTVINIVKDYVSKHQPNILLFAADSNEPSRVKLYNVLAAQASKELPGYNLAKTLKNKMFTVFYLTKDNVNVPKMDTAKNVLHKTLDKVFEDNITLNKLYGDNKPHRDDTIWDYGTMIWDNEYPIETINPNKLNLYLQSQYRIEHYEELFDMMDEEQQEIVEKYVNDPNLSDSIIVLDDGYIVDGNHRALAAVIANKPIKYIDIGEEDEPS